MDKSSELDCYLFYMWNRWDSSECDAVFGFKSERIWRKWRQCQDQYTSDGAPAPFYSDLTKTEREKIVERAVKYYNE